MRIPPASVAYCRLVFLHFVGMYLKMKATGSDILLYLVLYWASSWYSSKIKKGCL